MKITSRLIVCKIDGLLTQEGLAYHKELVAGLAEFSGQSIADCEIAIQDAVDSGYVNCLGGDDFDSARCYLSPIGTLLLALLDQCGLEDPDFVSKIASGEIAQNLTQGELMAAATLGLSMLYKWDREEQEIDSE